MAASPAGAHLPVMAALTPNDPAFQPGFERADTSVTAAVCLYGYNGAIDSLRFEAVVDAVEAFAAWVRSREQAHRT